MLAAIWKWITSPFQEQEQENVKNVENNQNQAEIIDWLQCSIHIGKSPKNELVKKQQQILLQFMEKKYRALIQQTSKTTCPLKYVLPDQIQKWMQPATHFIFTLVTKQGQTVKIPFSFHHLDDLFPVADLSLLNQQLNEQTSTSITATLLWNQSSMLPLDKSVFLRHFLYNNMAPGYPAGKGFRPHAWTWMFTSFAKGDSGCLLRLTRQDTEKSHNIQVGYIVLSKPSPIVWLTKNKPVSISSS